MGRGAYRPVPSTDHREEAPSFSERPSYKSSRQLPTMASRDKRSGESDSENEGDRQIFEPRDHEAGVVRQSTWKGAIWDTFDLPPKERKLLFKVDAVILTLASVSR